MIDENYEAMLIEPRKVEAFLGILLNFAKGPQEAYCILISCICILDNNLRDNPRSLPDLADDVAYSIRNYSVVDLQ